MTTVPCPRCGMPVGLDQEVCSHCRTPRDDMEMEEGRALVREEERRLKRRPGLIAAGAAAAVLLTAAWLLRGLVLGPLLVAWSDFQMEVEKTRQPSHWLKAKSAAPPAATPLGAAPPQPQVAVSSFVYLSAPSPGPQPGATPPSAPLPEPLPDPATPPAPVPQPADNALPSGPVAPGELRVRGTVYDLATKVPVKYAKIRFEQKRNGGRWEALTDAAGRYQVGLYKDSSDDVFVMIEAPGYRKGLLEDRDPPYRDRSAQARAELIAETTDNDLEPVPLRYKASAETVDLDLVLVPPVKK